MTLPDFIGIGVQKAGTTWLHALLKEHPRICMPKYRKEVHFFDKYYHRGRHWYESLFSHCGNKVKGEITPAYIYEEGCPRRIYELMPEVKLVVLLRDPVLRAYSHYKYSIEEEGFSGSFREFLTIRDDAIERGFYFKQLRRYLNYYPLDQVKIVIFEDMIAHPLQQLSRVFEFLGVQTDFLPSSLDQPVNPSQIPRWHRLYVWGKRITSKLHDLNLNWLIECLKKTGLKRFFFSDIGRQLRFPTLNQQDYTFLKGVYQEDVQQLSSLLNRDLRNIWFIGNDSEHTSHR